MFLLQYLKIHNICSRSAAPGDITGTGNLFDAINNYIEQRLGIYKALFTQA
jgi:hypothetical protein